MSSVISTHICKTCGNAFEGFYCNICGEKVIVPQDRSLKAVLNNIMQALTLADGKVVRTMAYFLGRPGFVSREFSEGRRVRYLKPITVFFTLNLIYFIFPVIQLFNASLKTQLRSPMQTVVQQMTAEKMIANNITDIRSFALIYDQKTAGLAKLIVMLFVLIASLPLNILYRKKGLYFADHMGYMVELVCFNLFINALLLSAILAVFGVGKYLDDGVLTAIFVVTNVYFLIMSGREFYRERGWRLIVKSLVMLLVLRAALEVYRAILFFITMAAL